MSKTVPQRSEIAPEHTWDTASIFANDAAWEAEFARVSGELPQLARFQGRLGEAPARLLEWLHSSEALLNAAGKVYLYASMLHNTNTADQRASAQYDRAIGLFNRVVTATAFAEPELLGIGFERLRRWVAEGLI